MATIKGKWIFKDSIPMGNSLWTEQAVNFTSNSTQYSSMNYTIVSDELAELYYGNTQVKNFGYMTNWTNEAYKEVDFGTSEQTVSDGFYTWFTTNTTQIIETPSTKIKSPVIVIKQKVKQVVIDNANMTIDIYTNEVPATLISFTIDGISYQAEEGMTWAEFINSDYNTGGMHLDNANYVTDGTLGLVSTDGNSSEKGTDVIIPNYAYVHYNPGAGGGND